MGLPSTESPSPPRRPRPWPDALISCLVLRLAGLPVFLSTRVPSLHVRASFLSRCHLPLGVLSRSFFQETSTYACALQWTKKSTTLQTHKYDYPHM